MKTQNLLTVHKTNENLINKVQKRPKKKKKRGENGRKDVATEAKQTMKAPLPLSITINYTTTYKRERRRNLSFVHCI
jgi:hypothetical protein